MQVFARDVPTPDGIWQLYSQIIQAPELWLVGGFKNEAAKCGLRKDLKLH